MLKHSLGLEETIGRKTLSCRLSVDPRYHHEVEVGWMAIAVGMAKMTAYSWLLVVKCRAALKKPIQPEESRNSPLPLLMVQHEGCVFPFSCGTCHSCLFCRLPVGGCQRALCERAAEVTWKFQLAQDVSPRLISNVSQLVPSLFAV